MSSVRMFSNDPHLNRIFYQMFECRDNRFIKSEWKTEREWRGESHCICGLGVGNIAGDCLRCGGRVGFGNRPRISRFPLKHAKHAIGDFVYYKGNLSEVDDCNESNPKYPRYRLVNCNTLEIIENALELDMRKR